jgi:hypothetical protein
LTNAEVQARQYADLVQKDYVAGALRRPDGVDVLRSTVRGPPWSRAEPELRFGRRPYIGPHGQFIKRGNVVGATTPLWW